MAEQLKVSLIISTYKNPEFLDKVLRSVSLQTFSLSEIIVTEDGEFEGNRVLIGDWKPRFKIPFHHLTQKDIGNRKPLALNRAILQSKGDYLIFIDGDCVLRKDFIADHIGESDENSFITGRRVELSQKASRNLTGEKISEGYLDGWPWMLILDSLFGKTHHWGRFFKTPRFLRKVFRRDKIDDIRGCNFSVYRKHMVAINGFDNDFSGAYGEDSDVEYRLKFLGLKMKSIRGAAIQYHLWHPTQTKDVSNQTRLEKVLRNKIYRVENGLSEVSQMS